jgi:hypothetical protein
LPPYNSEVFLNFDKGEYLSIGNKKVRVEKFIFKQADVEGEIQIWYSSKKHKIYKVFYEKEGISLEYSSEKTEEPSVKVINEENADVFKNKKQSEVIFFVDNKKVSAFLSRPEIDGEFPSIIFVQDISDPFYENVDMFEDLSQYLSDNGYVCMWMPFKGKTIVPGCKGLSLEDQYNLLSGAIDFLEQYRFVDTKKTFILSHGGSFSILPDFLKNEKRIKGWIALSPKIEDPIIDIDCDFFQKLVLAREEVDPKYALRISEYRQQTLSILQENSGQWKRILSQNVFLVRMRELLSLQNIEVVATKDIPMLSLYGMKDKYSSDNVIKAIKTAAQDNEFFEYEEFSNAGYFLVKGDTTIDEAVTVVPEVKDKVFQWLGNRTKQIEVELEQERLQLEKFEQERIEHVRLEQERLEQERLQLARLEQEILQLARLEFEKLEQTRLEREEQELLQKQEQNLEAQTIIVANDAV